MGKVTKTPLNITNESQEASPSPAGDNRAVMNRKFHISQISHCENLVPILHSAWKIGTNTSHISYQYFKLYVSYMRNLHIDKIHPKSAAFCIRFQFFTLRQDFITCFKQVTDEFHMFYSWKIWDRRINYMSRVARKRFFGFHAPDPCRYRHKH